MRKTSIRANTTQEDRRPFWVWLLAALLAIAFLLAVMKWTAHQEAAPSRSTKGSLIVGKLACAGTASVQGAGRAGDRVFPATLPRPFRPDGCPGSVPESVQIAGRQTESV